eukprot:5035500-Pyramimonas_sp.AAC.1
MERADVGPNIEGGRRALPRAEGALETTRRLHATAPGEGRRSAGSAPAEGQSGRPRHFVRQEKHILCSTDLTRRSWIQARWRSPPCSS